MVSKGVRLLTMRLLLLKNVMVSGTGVAVIDELPYFLPVVRIL